jgi:hypothetical protein
MTVVVSGLSPAVRRARALLDEYLSAKVTLDDLAVFVDVPPFRLLQAVQQARRD